MPIHDRWIIRLIVVGWTLVSAGCQIQRGYVVSGDWSLELNRTPWIGSAPGDCILEDCILDDGAIDNGVVTESMAAGRQAQPVEPEPRPSRFFPVPTRPAFAPPSRPSSEVMPKEIVPEKGLFEPTEPAAEEVTSPPALPEPTDKSTLLPIPRPEPETPIAPSPSRALSIRQPHFRGVSAVALRSASPPDERTCCGPPQGPPRHFEPAGGLDIAESWSAAPKGKLTYVSRKSRQRSVQLRR